MNVTKPVVVSAAVAAGMAALSVWAWPHTPALTAVHWGPDGTPDRYGSRLEALGMLPAITVAMGALNGILPTLMPPNSRLERSKRAYTAIWLALLGVLAVVHAAIVASGVGARVDVARVAVVTVGVLFLIMGNYLGKVRYNYVLGLRLPWTLSSERVWDRTHRFAGPLVMVGGAVLTTIGIIAPLAWSVPIVFLCTFGPVLIASVHSWRLSRHELTD